MTIWLEHGKTVAGPCRFCRNILLFLGLVLLAAGFSARAQGTMPMVAVHDSELTRAFANMPSTPDTPTGDGTTNKQWWSTDWNYYVMPESMKEALRSDGTPFVVVGDSNIIAGGLLTNGQPAYPIVISLASEAIDDNEIAQFTNYVAAGGFLFVGGSSFTRNTNGTTRGDFAFANAMGIHMVGTNLANWYGDYTLTNLVDHRLTSHIPFYGVIWRLPAFSEEVNWGNYLNSYTFQNAHDAWRIRAADATVLASGDSYPYYTIKQYGKGYFIYDAALSPLICTGGFGPGENVYLVFRRAIEWAFQNANMPVPRLSPWPYQYDAAYMIRHDLENYPDHITNILASAQIEAAVGAKGDYYFCTGVLKQDMPNGLVGTYNTNTVVQNIRQAITNYGATVSTHNGGLPNADALTIYETNYDYWHWGLDEVQATNVSGYASGVAYSKASLSNSFNDIESWFSGLMTSSLRTWVSPNFNCTREESYQIENQLNVKIAGDQKIGPFPHFTFSMQTPGQWFSFCSEPVSEWFVNGNLAQSLEPWHEPWAQNTNTLHQSIDFYFSQGFLINFYSHTMSTGLGDAGGLTPEYVSYCSNTNLHPRTWPINGVGLYQWWIARSNAQMTASFATNGNQIVSTISVKGATDPRTAVEFLVPNTNSYCQIQIYTNNTIVSPAGYRISAQVLPEAVLPLNANGTNPNATRTNGYVVRVLVGTSVTNVVLSYYPFGGATYFAENFDEVTEPALPSGWGTSASGGQSAWTTQNGPADSLPNSAYSTDASSAGVNELDSPAMTLPAGQSMLTFRNNYNLEIDPDNASDAFDGGVLEMKIGSGSYTDIVAAGGTFVSGAYNATINTNYGNPLAGRQAWSGTSSGFITTAVNLPAFATNTTVQFRWRCGTDSSNGSGGWNIDTVTIGGNACTCCIAGTNPPVLPGQASRTVNQFSTMVVTNAAMDANQFSLSYVLQNPPAGAEINSSGVITWTPGAGQAPSTNQFTTIATDLNNLSATNSFSVVVNDVDAPPVLPAQGNRTIVGLATMVVTNTASDTNVPAALPLTYGLVTAPTNATISTSGLITWTPVVAQVPSTNVISTVVTNFDPLAKNSQHVTATNSFTVFVRAVHDGPSLPSQPNHTINELAALVVTNTAIDSDIPQLPLTYTLLAPPMGAAINGNGIISWTPAGGQGPSTNTIRTVVSDGSLSATNAFTVVVVHITECQFSVAFAEDFDGAIVPALPTNGWATDSSGVGTNWVTQAAVSDTAPNAAFSPDEPNIALSELVSPSIALPTGQAILLFRNQYNLEVNTGNLSDGYDGGVLEIKIGTNAFADIITAGGSFTAGGYNATIDSAYKNPLTNRPAWSGNSGGFITTSVELPPAAAGQTVQFKWRLGCDNGNVAPGTPGWWVDSIVVSNMVCEPNGPALSAQPSRTIGELTSLVVTNIATNGTPPLTYSLVAPPQGAAISSNGVITWTPSEGQGPGNYTITTAVLDNSGLGATNSFSVDVLAVNLAPVLPSLPDRTIAGLTPFIVTNTASDPNIPPAVQGYFFLDAPSNAVISTNGVISWTPIVSQVPGAYAFTTVVTNFNSLAVTNQSLAATNTFSVTVDAVHNGPSLSAQPNRTVNLFAVLTVTNAAGDTDVPPQLPLTYQLLTAPAGASIDASGVITWSPTAGQAPATNVITTRVVDNGTPALAATNSFSVVVIDVNLPPSLPAQTNLTIAGLTPIVVTNTATDPNVPPAALSYGFVSAPTNALIDTNGVITWTPVEAQVPGTYAFTTIVTNYNPLAPINQRLTATNTFTVTVNAIHNGPSLPALPDTTVNELSPLTVDNVASDSDVPTPVLTYQLLNPPSGASIDSNGVIHWTPAEGQGPGTYSITTRVADNGAPPLAATNSFSVTVNDVNLAPVLPAQTNLTVAGLTAIVVTNTAIDPNIPATLLAYGFLDAPTNAAIDTNGVITWTPVAAQVPGTYAFTTIVTNYNPLALVNQSLTATNTFTVTVDAIHNGPSLGAQFDRTIDELTALIVVNTASDSDVPALALTYELIEPPAGAGIDANGVISGTPSEGQGPGTYSIITRVVDNGVPPLAATNIFTVQVNDVNLPPVLPAQTNLTIAGLTPIVVTNTAADPNIPATTLSYGFLAAPAGATIDGNGIIAWTPVAAQVPGTNVFTTAVTNYNPLALTNQRLTATNTFTVTVNAIHNGPSLPPLPDVSVNDLTLFVVTNAAVDSDIPPLPLSYRLLSAPAGAAIDASGVISWTPSLSQAGSTNILTTVVTDGGQPTLSATNSFLVTVGASPPQPLILSISVTNGIVWVTWTATAGYDYQLQYTDSPLDPVWIPGDTGTRAGGSTLTSTNVAGAMQRYYRVAILPGGN